MASGGVFHEVALYDQRPAWSYELWTFESVQDDNDVENIEKIESNGANTFSGKIMESQENIMQTSHKETNVENHAITECNEACTSSNIITESIITECNEVCTSSNIITESQITSHKETSEHLTNIDVFQDVDNNESLNTGAYNIDSKEKAENTERELDQSKEMNRPDSFSKQNNEKQNIDLTTQTKAEGYINESTCIDKCRLTVEDLNEDCKDDSESNEASNENIVHYTEVPEYEPDHWTDELVSDIPDTCPINTLIQAVSSTDISQTEAALQMKSELTPMLESTLDNLKLLYKVFQDSYLMPVGSMAEHSKIGKPDEFDFAVILPVLANEEYFGLLNKKNNPVTDSTILNLVSDIWTGDIEAVANSFQQGLKDLWSNKMMECVPDDWTVLNPSGHSDTHSVAATFHLEKKSDPNTRIDMDVCFWVPLNKDSLLKLQSIQLQQKLYITRHCLDEHGLAYVIMPHDSDVCLAINIVRFAMSRVERETLLKHGPENGRLVCYRTCKSLVSALVPKFRKNDECPHCFDSLISSYCLKNVVLYMAANHTDNSDWTADKVANRVLEVFTILTFCMKVNAGQVSAYFTPYQLSTDWSMTYDVSTKCVTDRDSNWYDSTEKPCVLPDLTAIKNLFNNDSVSKKAVEDYEELLTNSKWKYPEVICRLAELLTNLAQIEEEDRQGLTDDPGWNLFGLDLSPGESFVQCIETCM